MSFGPSLPLQGLILVVYLQNSYMNCSSLNGHPVWSSTCSNELSSRQAPNAQSNVFTLGFTMPFLRSYRSFPTKRTSIDGAEYLRMKLQRLLLNNVLTKRTENADSSDLKCHCFGTARLCKTELTEDSFRTSNHRENALRDCTTHVTTQINGSYSCVRQTSEEHSV